MFASDIPLAFASQVANVQVLVDKACCKPLANVLLPKETELEPKRRTRRNQFPKSIDLDQIDEFENRKF